MALLQHVRLCRQRRRNGVAPGRNRSRGERSGAGTGYFLGQLKASVARALCDVFHRQRRAAALEWAIRQPNKAIFEVRPRGRLQRQLIAGARDEL